MKIDGQKLYAFPDPMTANDWRRAMHLPAYPEYGYDLPGELRGRLVAACDVPPHETYAELYWWWASFDDLTREACGHEPYGQNASPYPIPMTVNSWRASRGLEPLAEGGNAPIPGEVRDQLVAANAPWQAVLDFRSRWSARNPALQETTT